MEIIGYGILLAIGFAIAPTVISFALVTVLAVIAGIASIFRSK